LNLCYLLGEGTAPNEKQAFRWVQKSAQAGFPDAALALAWHYHNGRGVEVNLRQAEYWYRKAARSGEASAQFSLGQLSYDSGHYASTKKWFLKAVAQNHRRSNYYLGRMYLAGHGVRKDATTARSFLRQAVKLGDRRAMRLLQSKILEKALASQPTRGRPYRSKKRSGKRRLVRMR
jgi:hypothetical protein